MERVAAERAEAAYTAWQEERREEERIARLEQARKGLPGWRLASSHTSSRQPARGLLERAGGRPRDPNPNQGHPNQVHPNQGRPDQGDPSQGGRRRSPGGNQRGGSSVTSPTVCSTVTGGGRG